MIQYGKTEFDRDLVDVIELCQKWWKDSLFHKTYGIEYKVDIDFFRGLHEANLMIYTIGRDEGKAVSCYVGVVTPYMFNTEINTANEIVWCLDKEYRGFKNLVQLSDAIENLMDEESVELWNLNVSNEEKYNSTGEFLKRKEYTLMDNCFSKFRRE